MSARFTALRLLATAALGAGLLAQSAQAAGPPQIKATWVEGVSATGATLWAEVNPNGAPSTYRFEYVSDAAFQKSGFATASKIPASGPVGIGAGEAAVKVSQHPAGLIPASLYHYRVAATNSFEAIQGPPRTLSTEDATNLFTLPDARAWELVSPIDKDGGAIQGPGQNFGGDLDQAAAQGNLFTYSASSAFANAPGAPPASQYIASRTTGGWVSQNVSTALRAGAYGEVPGGVPYRLFSPDLGKGLFFGGGCVGEAAQCAATNPALPGSGGASGYGNYYLRSSAGGSFTALLNQAAVVESSLGPKDLSASAVSATPDLSHVVLSSCAALSANATEVPAGPGQCDPEEQNLYEWSSAGLSLINLLPGDSAGTPGAEIGASLGAISSDGLRVYWKDLNNGNLYLREGTQTVQVDEAQGGGGSFESASSDGSIAYFSADVAGVPHLFRWLALSKTATDLTPSGEVIGVLGASADGSSVYYQDATGLKLWHQGAITTIAPGANATLPANYHPATGAARVSADGTHLAFLSAAELTDYENVGKAEAYLYGPLPGGGSAQLICASCNPTGERPKGAALLPGAPPNGSVPSAYKPRVLVGDGSKLFFESADSLSFQDSNGAPDVYQWEAKGIGACQRTLGCVNLLSSGRSDGGATLLDASADGADVFFLTDASLVGADPGSIDVYDAKVGGGFAEAPKPIPCIGDACQALPAPPDDPTPGTLVPNGGNPGLQIEKEKPKKKHHKKGKGKKGKGKGHKGAKHKGGK